MEAFVSLLALCELAQRIHSALPGRVAQGRGISPRTAALAVLFYWGDCSPERVRAISIARLPALPLLHLRPIYVIVFDGPMWRSYLEGGFVLRCFQHLSWPEAATRRCGWRHNRFTGAPSNTVLSY